MTRRLLLAYLGLAVTILAVLEIPLGLILASRERADGLTSARRQATTLAVGVEADLQRGDRTAATDLLAAEVLKTRDLVEVVAPGGGRMLSVAGHAFPGGVAKEVAAALGGRVRTGAVGVDDVSMAVAAIPLGPDAHPSAALVLAEPLDYYGDVARDIWLALAAFAGVVLVLAGGVGWRLARSLSAPMADLERVAARLGRGELATRARLERGPWEIRSLADQFDRMAEQLAELITAQRRFVADASHQLRSPLTALRLRLENLEAQLPPAAESLAAAGQEVQRLSRIVDGLLRLSSADAAAPDLQPVDLAEVVAGRGGAWAALAAERHVELAVALLRSGEPAAVGAGTGVLGSGVLGTGALGDGRTRPAPVEALNAGRVSTVAELVPGDLEQILDNLLANALEVSPEGGRIDLSLTAGRGRVELHVTDQGPGLSEADRVRAFDRFWQGPAANRGHSGLGLAIVAQLAARNRLSVDLRPAAGGGLDAVVTASTRSASSHY